jgi:hypothetical protein
MTASIRRSTLERYNQKKSISGKEWLADLVGEAAAENIDWASPSAKASRRAKAETKNIFSGDTASADAFAAKFENARSGSRSCFVQLTSQNTPPKTSETIRPNTDVLCFVEKKGKMCRAKVSATPDWVWTTSLTKPVQRCQTLFRYLEILKIGLKFNRHINGF